MNSDVLQVLTDWMNEHPIVTSVVKYLFWVILVLLVISVIRRYLKRKLPDSGVLYKTQKGIEIFGYILIGFITVSYFTGNIRDFTLAIGLFTAGVTITLQEIILSVAGSFYIFFVKVYKPGDRIEIQGIKGDVIDIDSVYTTMMEIGQWVSSDNYSGRIVKVSNAFVFKGPVYNYSRDFPFVWDEFDLPIRYGSDVEKAKKIVVNAAQEILSEFVSRSINKWEEVVSKYYIEDAMVEPTLAITLTDNWVKLNLRYIVDYKRRRTVKNQLHERILHDIQASDGAVQLASATYEVVSIPTVEIHNKQT